MQWFTVSQIRKDQVRERSDLKRLGFRWCPHELSWYREGLHPDAPGAKFFVLASPEHSLLSSEGARALKKAWAEQFPGSVAKPTPPGYFAGAPGIMRARLYLEVERALNPSPLMREAAERLLREDER